MTKARRPFLSCAALVAGGFALLLLAYAGVRIRAHLPRSDGERRFKSAVEAARRSGSPTVDLAAVFPERWERVYAYDAYTPPDVIAKDIPGWTAPELSSEDRQLIVFVTGQTRVVRSFLVRPMYGTLDFESFAGGIERREAVLVFAEGRLQVRTSAP